MVTMRSFENSVWWVVSFSKPLTLATLPKTSIVTLFMEYRIVSHSVTTFGDREEGSGNRRTFNNKISADPRLLGALRRMGGGGYRYCMIFTLHDLTDLYVERVTAHRIKINHHSCFHNLWPNSKTKLKLKHLCEQGGPLVFRGPYAACVFYV